MKSMKRLKWWMLIVGAFYIVLGFINTPPLMTLRFNMQYPTIDLPVADSAVQALIDMWFVFGVEMLVVGVLLMVASRNPLQNKILVITVIVLELVRGILMDAYWLTRGIYTSAPYLIWIIIHLVILLSGFVLLRRAQRETRTSQAQPMPVAQQNAQHMGSKA